MSYQVEHDKAFFWSDTHFFHKAAAKARGWGHWFNDMNSSDDLFSVDVESMNTSLVRKARKVLKEDSVLFLLGDVSFGKFSQTQEILDSIPGKKVLVMGNHDAGLAKHLEKLFDEVHDLLTVKVVEYTGEPGHLKKNVVARIQCCHYPLFSWKDMHHGSWHLHGHCHGSLQWQGIPGKMLDVGVDDWGQHGPISFAQVQAIMDGRPIVSFDHHKPNLKEQGDWTL